MGGAYIRMMHKSCDVVNLSISSIWMRILVFGCLRIECLDDSTWIRIPKTSSVTLLVYRRIVNRQAIVGNREALCVMAPGSVVQVARCVYDVFCMTYCTDSGLGYAWPYHEQVDSWLVLECVINMSGEVHINDTIVWGYKRGGSYIPCSHLRVAVSGEVHSWMDHACWTTGKEIHRVKLRVGKFVELDHERESSWNH